MKPFDLEAAKRGEPIQTIKGGLLYFIGVTRSGSIMIETESCYTSPFKPDQLRIAPKKRTVWVNFYIVYETEAEANRGAVNDRVGGKAYPVEIDE